MKRFWAILLSALMLLGILASCGEHPSVQPASSDALESGSEEPGTVPGTEPVASKFETEYVAPEDGSFTICGTPLSEYSLVLYYPNNEEYAMSRKQTIDAFLTPINQATGKEWDLKVVKNQKYDTDKWAEHEILFGDNFRREGIPEPKHRNYYGVTADGTVYFCGVTPLVYGYMIELFLEEFFGVVPGSGEPSAGCRIGECYREVPLFSDSELEKRGYSCVVNETFDGDSLNLDLWQCRASGPERDGFNSASQIAVRDGKLILTGEYLTEGEFGEGWYAARVSLNQKYCRGYFEATIKISQRDSRNDFGSAFWIQGPAPYTPELSRGGVGEGGAEIDIMENWAPDYYTGTIWVSGYEGKEGLSGQGFTVYSLRCDYTEDFHTFALLWDEDYYEFYVDGLMVQRTNFGYGTSTVEEEVILSLELTEQFRIDHDIVRVMEVDSMRVWQKTTEE
ncbi:MAG: family 16 glycosylhydrolase [Candidatus Methanomethylophilaceae archaeon]|nr:family 16 glycosylhydrolase [Candidatus Methanomethylophilaceae archaeon]